MASVAMTSTVLKWEEAEALFVQKHGMPAASYYALEEYCRELGFTITRISSYQMMMRAKQKLEELIASGGQLDEFVMWAETQMPAWSYAYTQLVFRMAAFGAYNQARFEQMNAPEVRETFEVWFYDAINDSRTREEHAAMSGRSWPAENFPMSWYPPNGFNCRCEVRAVLKSMVKKLGLNTSGRVPRYPKRTKDGKPHPRASQTMTPDKGFTRNIVDRDRQRLNLNFRLRTLRNELGA